jgi:hypothetical protein
MPPLPSFLEDLVWTLSLKVSDVLVVTIIVEVVSIDFLKQDWFTGTNDFCIRLVKLNE